jgi:hypothetical protein
VALPLLGFFFCVIAVLTAVAGTISFFSTSTSERVHHYPRPVVERNVARTNNEPRLFMVVPDTKDTPPAKNTEANPVSIPAASSNASIPAEKAEIKKNKPHKPKVFARLRNYERRGYYGNTPGYAQETQYGLQRPFSNW